LADGQNLPAGKIRILLKVRNPLISSNSLNKDEMIIPLELFINDVRSSSNICYDLFQNSLHIRKQYNALISNNYTFTLSNSTVGATLSDLNFTILGT